jgi:hypothetical protein
LSPDLSPSTVAICSVATADEFARHIRQYVDVWFGDMNAKRTRLRLQSTSRTRNSCLYEFRVAEGRKQHGLIAKVPFVLERARHVQRYGQTQDDIKCCIVKAGIYVGMPLSTYELGCAMPEPGCGSSTSFLRCCTP